MGAQNFEKNCDAFTWRVKKGWFLWDEIKGHKHNLLKHGFDKQPGGLFITMMISELCDKESAYEDAQVQRCVNAGLGDCGFLLLDSLLLYHHPHCIFWHSCDLPGSSIFQFLKFVLVKFPAKLQWDVERNDARHLHLNILLPLNIPEISATWQYIMYEVQGTLICPPPAPPQPNPH